jgi:arylsulfatase A-like enzyme
VTVRRVAPTAIAVAVAAALSIACSPADSRPNLVLILADDLGYRDVSLHGGGIPTPEIDQLAASGVRFTQAYSTSSVCAPSRAAILTGRYQNRFGFEFNLLEAAQAETVAPGLPTSETTLAELLSGAGYKSAVIGKWHLGLASRFSPLSRGFDEFFGSLWSSLPYFPVDTKRRVLIRGHQPYVEDEYLTDAFTREAVDFIARNREDPFFLFLSYTAPHTPMQATRESMKGCSAWRGGRRRYCGMVRSLDHGVGRVLRALREHGIEDETLVVFTNDNGGASNNFANNRPLRGFKGGMYEGGLRVPMMMRWGGRIAEGTIYSEPVSTLDIFATFLAAAGAASPPRPIDGVDLLPFLSDPASGTPHPILFWRRGPRSAVRVDDWKLVGHGASLELFDLASDPRERSDLSARDPRRVEALERAYAAWESEMVQPSWKEMKPGRPAPMRERAK